MESIRPLKTEADYDWAIAEITRYFENEPEAGSSEGGRFDVLAALIKAYEDTRYPIVASDSAAMR
ncbi:transcriptional regulator [Mesorhizobium amorphae]|uniref:transcriptional regulator n=1 Tax=Mesorhizobium amorphae TaxID=71433 RepID=UPI001185CE87|nr:transcriptional regulator [Mesorhizobium amorphae]